MKKRAFFIALCLSFCTFLFGCSGEGTVEVSPDVSVFPEPAAVTPTTEPEIPASDSHVDLIKPEVPFGFDKLDAQQKSFYRLLEEGGVTSESPFMLTGDTLTDKKYTNTLLLYEHNNSRVSDWNTMSYRVEYDSQKNAVAVVPSDNLANNGYDDEMKKRFYVAADKLLERLPAADADDFTKIKAIAELLCDMVEYNYLAGGYKAKTADQFEAEAAPHAAHDYGAIVYGSAICTGYASAFQYLCGRLGVYAILVLGNSDGGGPHAWNMVFLDGAYYHVDITWMDAAKEGYLYQYFLASDSQLFTDHFNIRYSDTVDTKTDPDMAYLFEIPSADRVFRTSSTTSAHE